MRRPKPSNIRILEGMRGHRPLNHREPQVSTALGDPPHWFNEHQRGTWAHALEHCPVGMLKETDRAVFVLYCVHEFNFTEATTAMIGQPLMIRQPPSNRLCENPLSERIRDESRAMLRCITELGFSPSARTRVHVDISAPVNEFDDVTKPARKAG